MTVMLFILFCITQWQLYVLHYSDIGENATFYFILHFVVQISLHLKTYYKSIEKVKQLK